MLPEFVDRTGGSRWVQAPPARQTSVGVWGSAKRSGAYPRRERFAPRNHADLGRFNLWRSMVVARIRGSMCVQAQPAGSRWNRALPGGGQRSSIGCAAACACRLSLPEPPPVSPRRQRRHMISRKLLEIRRPWPLQSMAANGRRQDTRQQAGAGSACPRNSCGAVSSSLPAAKHPEALTYGRRMRLAGASTASKLSLDDAVNVA